MSDRKYMTDADPSRGIENYGIKLGKISNCQTNYVKDFDSCYFGRPYFGRLLDLLL